MKEEDKLKYLMDFDDDNTYYSDREFITNSMLGRLDKSPQHLQMYLDGHMEVTPALTFGKAFHTMILEPNKLDSDIAVYEGKTRRGKAWDEFSLDNQDKTIISASEWNVINAMSDEIINNPVALDFINTSEKEVVNIWTDEQTGIKCKGKADMVAESENGKILIDIKTTQDASIEAFRRSAWKYGYDRQAAYYMDGFDAVEFWFVVIEKSSPHRIGIYKASDKFIDEGRKKNSMLLDYYHQYFIAKDKKVNEFYFKGEL